MLSIFPRAIVRARVLSHPFNPLRFKPQSYASYSTLSTPYNSKRDTISRNLPQNVVPKRQLWDPKLYFEAVEEHIHHKRESGAAIAVEPLDHGLKITTELGEYVLINKPPSDQIWLRTPHLGIIYFSWDSNEGWKHHCDGETLSSILKLMLDLDIDPSTGVCPGAYCFRR
ncbi:hypothetical protein DM02DRAFT_413152 [Periconia macrospinosa]|uniref:Uncharacterized protein n=1 Tax=Periconia macrospinosa TaxID=97972 RepID=A0A2V1DPZ3_9PLEO|nr:hypothetical protein DM02DRAFT_413152 [Periconia macrospinosa]